MKSDNRGLFDVFKKGERDDLSFGQKLAYWFKEVYWCNFKGLTFLALFGIICAIVFVCDVSGHKDNDLDYVVAGNATLAQEQLDGIEEFITKNMRDANGDGKVTVAHQSLPVTSPDDYDQIAAAAEDKLYVSMADDNILLYILDGDHMEMYAVDGAFEPLSTFGFDTENQFCYEISDSKIFKELGIPKATSGWYIGVKVVGPRSDKEDIMDKYAAIPGVISAFMEK